VKSEEEIWQRKHRRQSCLAGAAVRQAKMLAAKIPAATGWRKQSYESQPAINSRRNVAASAAAGWRWRKAGVVAKYRRNVCRQ